MIRDRKKNALELPKGRSRHAPSPGQEPPSAIQEAVTVFQKEARYRRSVRVLCVADVNVHFVRGALAGQGDNKEVTYFLAVDADPGSVPLNASDQDLFSQNDGSHRYVTQWVDEASLDSHQFIHRDYKKVIRKSFGVFREKIRSGAIGGLYPP